MAVSFNSLLSGFRQASKSVILHEHSSLLRFGDRYTGGVFPFFSEDTELCQDVCKFEVVVEMASTFSVTLLRVVFTDLPVFFFQRTLSH